MVLIQSKACPSFSDPLEEVISTGKIPYQVVVLGADELSDPQDGNAPKVASVDVTEEHFQK